jgi:CheY-like chemotaxis protein
VVGWLVTPDILCDMLTSGVQSTARDSEQDTGRESMATQRIARTTGTTGTTGRANAARILLIEDDESTREAVRFILTEEGYDVREATNAMDGHALLLASQEPLVAVLDFRLPALDGCDLLDIIAHDEQLREQHAFVMISASPKRAEDDCGDTLADLDVPLLGKPFDIDELLGAVQEAQQRLESAEQSA